VCAPDWLALRERADVSARAPDLAERVRAYLAFGQRGAAVESRPSPWLLGADQAELTEEWLRGWIGTACEPQPDLGRHASAYLRRRLDPCTAAELRVVGHVDVLAVPTGAS
jgi:hypothetical protein